MAEGEHLWTSLKETRRNVQLQQARAKIAESNYLKESKDLLLREEGRDYLSNHYTKKRREASTKARFRLRSRNEACTYWRTHEEKLYRLCGDQEETLEHVFVNCMQN